MTDDITKTVSRTIDGFEHRSNIELVRNLVDDAGTEPAEGAVIMELSSRMFNAFTAGIRELLERHDRLTGIEK